MDEQRRAAVAEIGKAYGDAMQRAADAMENFGKVWRASEAAEQLRGLGYSVRKD